MEILAITLSGLALLAAGVLSVLYVQEKKRNEKQRADALVEYAKSYKELLERIDNLEKGIVPDFEEAKSAVKAVDEFNRGLSNIMGFDPMKALQRDRNRSQGKGVD